MGAPMIWLIAMVVMAGGDTLEMRDSTEGHAAELLYINSAGQSSGMGVYHLSHNGIQIAVRMDFEPGSTRERIKVTVLDGQHVAIPEEIAVADGEETVIQIYRPMF